MAGIAATLDLEPGLPPAEELVRAMLASLAHRGPDGEAVAGSACATLGARAFAAVDGASALAQSPRLLLALDGDLTNLNELAVELGCAADDPAGIALAAWTRWGAECLGRLDGPFALVVWDRFAERLTCAVDPLGLRPLYYTVVGRRLHVASEIRGLLADPAVPRVPNDRRIVEYLAYGLCDHSDETMLEGIRRIPMGALVVTTPRNGAPVRSRWHELAPEPLPGDPAKRIRELLEDAVARRLRGNPVFGATLSGGIDSTSVLAIAARLRREAGEQPPLAIIARPEDPRLDEWRYASLLVERYSIPVEQVRPRDDELVSDLDAFVRAVDEPVHGPTVYAHWRVMRAARDAGVQVVLEGQGGARFGSIAEWYPHVLFEFLRHGHPARAVRELRDRERVQGVAAQRSALDVAKLMLPRAVRAAHQRPPAWLTQPVAPPPLPRRGNLAYQLFDMLVWEQPVTNREVDRDSASNSVVARSPFEDLRLVRYALSLPAETLLDHGRPKAPVIRGMRGIVPDEILDRGVKQGLAVDTASWLHDALGAEMERTLAGDEARSRPYWDADALLRSVREGRAGRGSATALWRAFSVERWLRVVASTSS